MDNTNTIDKSIEIIEADPSATNKDLADKFALIANYYVMSNDTYRAKTYANASNKVANYNNYIISGAQARKEIFGIGQSIQNDIDEYINTGNISRLITLEINNHDRKEVIDYFSSFYGIGPVTAVRFYNLGFRTLEDLWHKGNLTDAQKIGILWRDHINLRIDRSEMLLISQKITSMLSPYGIKFDIAGSFRRQEPSSGDIDLLIESRPDFNMDSIVNLLKDILPATLAQGPTKYMGIIRIDDQHNGHRIDIRLIEPYAYAAGLMYFTGSQRFNILMRQRAIDLKMTLNEYGLYLDNQPLPVNSEEDIFSYLHVHYLSPIERTRDLNNLIVI